MDVEEIKSLDGFALLQSVPEGLRRGKVGAVVEVFEPSFSEKSS